MTLLITWEFSFWQVSEWKNFPSHLFVASVQKKFYCQVIVAISWLYIYYKVMNHNILSFGKIFFSTWLITSETKPQRTTIFVCSVNIQQIGNFWFLSYSISSTIMDVDSTISSGRSTPVMMNGQGVPASSAKSIAYNCCWDHCHACFSSSPDLADHIRSIHVDGQRGGVGVTFLFSLSFLVANIFLFNDISKFCVFKYRFHSWLQLLLQKLQKSGIMHSTVVFCVVHLIGRLCF